MRRAITGAGRHTRRHRWLHVHLHWPITITREQT
jgi:hypothetical protein